MREYSFPLRLSSRILMHATLLIAFLNATSALQCPCASVGASTRTSISTSISPTGHKPHHSSGALFSQTRGRTHSSFTVRVHCPRLHTDTLKSCSFAPFSPRSGSSFSTTAPSASVREIQDRNPLQTTHHLNRHFQSRRRRRTRGTQHSASQYRAGTP